MIEFSKLAPVIQSRIADRANVRMVAAVFAVLALLYALMPSPAARAMYVGSTDSVGSSVRVHEDSPDWNPATMGNGRGIVSWTPRTGTVKVFSGKGYTGSRVGVEASPDNRGWCIRVGNALPGHVGRSIQNDTGRTVKAYASSDCTTRGFTVKAYGSRSGVNGGPVYVRSMRIS